MDMVPMKRRFLMMFHRLGYHVMPMRDYRPVDLRDSSLHPLETFYRYPWRHVLIKAPVRLGFGLFHYPLDRRLLLNSVIETCFKAPDQAPQVLRETLSTYYQEWRPSTASEFLRIADSEIPALSGVPPWSVPWPWEPLDIGPWRDLRSSAEARENADFLKRDLSIHAGWKSCGPVTDEKLEVEVGRFSRLIQSIQTNGFQRHDGLDGDISAVILCSSDGEWRWQVIAGGHRFAVMASLGVDTVPVRIERIVRRDDVAYWAGVSHGIYTPEVALKIFDRFFEILPMNNAHNVSSLPTSRSLIVRDKDELSPNKVISMAPVCSKR